MGVPLVVLGIIQGLTEFLPISSSGHLIVARYLLGVRTPGATAEIVLHLGTLIAIGLAFRADFKPGGRFWNPRILARVAVASVPAGLAGVLLGDVLTQFFIPAAAALGFLCTSALLWLTPKEDVGRQSIEELSWKSAGWVGLFQALALWPGLSRSGTTIFAARVGGLAPEEATAFAFWMAIPATAGAVLWELLHSSAHLEWTWSWGLALALAAISGMFAVQWVKVSVRSTKSWRRFGAYTAGLAVLAWSLRG